MKNNNFKIILLGVFGLFILVGFLAFATFRGKSADPAQNVTVRIWGTMDSSTFNNFIAKYSQNIGQQDIKVSYTEMGSSEIYNNVIEAIASGGSPDAILVGQEQIKRFSGKTYSLPFTTISQRTFYDTFVQEASIYEKPDGFFGMPFYIDPLVMYWNKDIFFTASIATPPQTWAEFPILAGKLSVTDSNATVKKSAVSFGEYSNVNNAKAILSTLILQSGNPIVSNQEGSLRANLYQGQFISGAVSAVNFFMEYSNPQKSVYSWNRSLPSSEQAFLRGDLATYFGFASEAQDLKAKNPNLNFDVAMMPQVVNTKTKITFGEVYGFALLRSSPNPAAASNMIFALTSAEASQALASISFLAPARNDIISRGTSDPAKTVFYKSALISRGWIDPNFPATDGIFSEMISNISSGRKTTAESLEKASSEINNLL